MHPRSSLSVLLAIIPAGVGFLAACGGGTPAEAVRPKDQTFAAAMGEGGGGPCREPESGAEPLVVDWKPEQRGDLEVLMREKVAVVSYSCKGFKLLKDCKVDGKYGFIGMTKKEQVVKLTNADEVKANLPLAGAGLAANLSAEMQRGATLDVALVMIGKVKTTWGKVSFDDLKEDCDGATHFVKGATVGAFVMETGSKGEVKSAAQLFGAGASGGSSSSKNIRNQDGDLSDCAKASPDSPKAPSQCQAIVRLELKAIAPKAKPASGGESKPPSPEPKVEVAAPEPTCPQGMVMADGKCTEPKSAAAYLCKPNDAKECLEQCGKGNTGSCGAAGALLASGHGGASRDDAKARELLGKGCDGGDGKSCSNLAMMLAKGRGGGKDAAGAVARFTQSCAAADAFGCGMLGAAYETGGGTTKDEGKAAGFLQKGCDGGDGESCGRIGRMYLDGRGVAKNVQKGATALKLACDGGQVKACIDVGELYESGKDVGKNPILAKMMYERACFRSEGKGCSGQGRMELGFGGSPDAAKRAFEMGCWQMDDLSCAASKILFGGTRPVFAKPQEMMERQRACDMGSVKDCAIAGTLQIASGNKVMGMPMIERACMQQDALACAVKKK